MNTSKKIISLLMCMLMVLTMVPMSVFAVEATEIDTINIEGVPEPKYGQTPKDYLDDVIAKVKVNNEPYDSINQTYGNLNVEWQAIYDSTKTSLSSSEILTAGTYYYLLNLYPKTGFVFADIDDISASVNGNASVELEASTEYDDTVLVWVKFEVAAPTEITAVELTVSGYQCGGYANQITFTGSEGTYMIPSTYPVFTDINDFEGTALDKYDGFCRDTEYWVSAAFAAADGYALPELSKDDITLKGFTVLDKYVSYDATEQIIWVAFKLSAHSFDDDSDNTCNLCNKERYTYTEADGKVTITAYNGLGGAVNIPSTLGTNGYPVTVIGEEAFSENYGITSVSIPDSVTTIEEEAFYDNELTSVHIGKGVTSIGEDAFAFSAEFETITVDEDNDYYLSENNVLFDIDKEELIVYAVKKTDTSYTVPATVKKIHRSAFNFAKNLKSITISDGVTDIGSFAFSGCKNITSLIIPNSVTSIGSYAFGQMDNLKYVIISDKLTTVSSYAFQFCENLTDVVIPASVTSIEGGAFRYCSSLSDIYYTGTQAQWENVAVNNNSGYHDKFLSANVHYNAQVVDGHVYDNACDAECNLCTEIRTAPHTYENVITKATLTTNGLIESKCSVCGDVKSTVTVYYPKTIKLSSAEVTYNGKVRSPSVTVKDSKGNTLVKGTDYDVTTPSGRKAPGQYTYTIKFKGNYSGEKKLTFTILPETVDVATIKATQSTSVIKLTWGAVEGATGYRVYQYSASKGKFVQIASVKGVTSYRKATNLKAGTEYKFKVKAYTKLSDGTVLWATASKEFLTATECKAPSITSVTSPSKSKATVKWSNVDGETGFQLYYSTKKDSGYKKVSSYAADKLTGSKTFSSSASGKTIYFKVRAYKKAGGQTIYGEWSAVKSVKLK